MPEEQKKPTNKVVKKKRDWSDDGNLPYDRIPAFKVAYDCYKECIYRMRNVPVDSKPVAREVKSKLMRTMVCIAHARLNIHVLESLQEAVDNAIEIQITLRVLAETNAITHKDFANISKYSENLVRQMVGWALSENKKIEREQVLSDLSTNAATNNSCMVKQQTNTKQLDIFSSET